MIEAYLLNYWLFINEQLIIFPIYRIGISII